MPVTIRQIWNGLTVTNTLVYQHMDLIMTAKSLACNYETTMEVTDNDKHSSLLAYQLNYSLKK